MNGFLHAEGKKILDGDGKEVLLQGWGLGNWFVPEGYMWLADHNENFDRPSRIDRTLRELCGDSYMDSFWQRWRERFIKREDIRYLHDLGFNSIRVPLSWRSLMDEQGSFKEETFELLDRLISWCRELEVYVFLDLHAAPGGQTGANIDDTEDDVPRLFMERKYQLQTIALWEEIARRYREEITVGGYDLLNEPIMPPFVNGDHDDLIPEERRFMGELAARVRQADPNHLLSIEGVHFASDPSAVDKVDSNMVLHFHYYGQEPSVKSLRPYLDRAEELDVPLWMGETGENSDRWYAAAYGLARAMGIGYNVWCWKKMDCSNSPLSIKVPEHYQAILDYTHGGEKPSEELSQKIMDQLLHNILIENCKKNESVCRHVLRKVPFSLQAADFDEFPGRGFSWGRTSKPDVSQDEDSYRQGTGMEIVNTKPSQEKKAIFDSMWERYVLRLSEGDYVFYTVLGASAASVEVEEEIPGNLEIRRLEGGVSVACKSGRYLLRTLYIS